MRRTNATTVRVVSPAKGLSTRSPSDLPDRDKNRFLTVAKNVRAWKDQVEAAPGYERISTPDRAIETPANLIHQPNLVVGDDESRRLPVIGTETELLTMRKRSSPLVCPIHCSVNFAVTADSGRVGPDLAAVAGMIRSWDPDLVIHAGDLVYAAGAPDDQDTPYESQVAQYYSWAIGGYPGPYERGSSVNRFLPVAGNHDYDDGPAYRFFDYFHIRQDRPWYTVKRGPVQFFFLDSYGYGPVGTGPGGTALNGTGAAIGVGQADLSPTSAQAVWLQTELAASDCPWRIVVWHHASATSEATKYPGYSVLQSWPLGAWGVDVLLTGHSHIYERITRTDGVIQLTVGTGGNSLRTVNSTLVAGSQKTYAAKYSALRVAVTQKVFTAELVSVDGHVQDTVSLTTARTPSVCYILGMARQIGGGGGGRSGLQVTPEVGTGVAGVAFPFKATVVYTDGTVEDVTATSAWSSSDIAVASVASSGRVTGILAGEVTITAQYHGLTASGIYTVQERCLDDSVDSVLLLDVSGSMNIATPPFGTRIDRLKEAAALFLDTLRTGDRVATLVFSTDAGPLHHLTSDVSAARTAIGTLVASGATHTQAGMEAAGVEMATYGRPFSKKVVVLFTDGFANLPTPEPMEDAAYSADQLKLAGYVVVVIGLDLRWDPIREAKVRGWASCPDLYYSVDSARDLLTPFASVRNGVCQGLCSSGGPIGMGLL